MSTTLLSQLNWTLGDTTLKNAYFIERGMNINSEQVKQYLNQLIPITSDRGQVALVYPIPQQRTRINYSVQSLPTGLYVLGAINTFYQQSLDDGNIRALTQSPFTDILLNRLRKGQTVMLSDIMTERNFRGLEEIRPGEYLVKLV